MPQPARASAGTLERCVLIKIRSIIYMTTLVTGAVMVKETQLKDVKATFSHVVDEAVAARRQSSPVTAKERLS